MNALTVIVLAAAAIAIYKVASDRGKRKVAEAVIERDEEIDLEELANERENWDNTNAGDNLNDAVAGKKPRKRQSR
jgi:hypothetical protein